MYSFREEFLHTLIVSVITYLIVGLIGRQASTPILITFFNCAYLFICHLNQQFSNWGGYQLDFTTVQMIITIKLSQYAFNVYDGIGAGKTSPDQERWALKAIPSPLVFLGFLYYFPGLSAGPAFEITDYISFTDLTMYKDCPNSFPSRLSALFATFLKLFTLIFCFVGLTIAGDWPTSWALCAKDSDPALSCEIGGLSGEFLALPLYLRIGYLWISSALVRYSYYFAWTLSDMASTLCGLGYNGVGKDGSLKWDRLTNCRMLDVETGQSTRTCINGWNLGNQAHIYI